MLTKGWGNLKTISGNGLANLKYIARWPSHWLSNMDQRDASASKNQNERKVLLRANSIILTVRSFTLNYLHSDVRLYQMASWNKILRFFSNNARFKNVLIKEKLDALWKVALLIVFIWVYRLQILHVVSFSTNLCVAEVGLSSLDSFKLS